MYTQRDAHHGVHVAPRKIAAAAAAAAACGRARGAWAAPAACKGNPGAAHRGRLCTGERDEALPGKS